MSRTINMILAGIFLILVLPVGLLIGAAICADSRGPVFYRGLRVGKNGRLFRMWKFRTMYSDDRGRLTPAEAAEFNIAFKLDNDSRVTRIGRWLRRLSLDELPQLVNVLTGDMAFIGPRPKLPEELHLYGSSREELLSVTPGITGYWQVYRSSARSDATMRKLDLYYVRHKCLRLDAKILMQTVHVLATKTNS